MMTEVTERFHQQTAANGRDLNTILADSDIAVITEALSRYISLMHSEACMKGMTAHKDSEAKKWHDRYSEQYERACVAYHRVTGKSAII